MVGRARLDGVCRQIHRGPAGVAEVAHGVVGVAVLEAGGDGIGNGVFGARTKGPAPDGRVGIRAGARGGNWSRGPPLPRRQPEHQK